MRDAEEVARRALGTLFCLSSEPASEWCHIHDTEWEAPHDHYCNEGERVVARLADAIRARDAEVRAEALAQVDEFAILLAATREGLARSNSKAKGVEQVRDMLAEHAGAIHRAAEDAGHRRHRGQRHWNRPWEPEPTRDQEDR